MTVFGDFSFKSNTFNSYELDGTFLNFFGKKKGTHTRHLFLRIHWQKFVFNCLIS